MAILIIVGALILFYIVIKVYECYYYKKVDNEIPREIQISQNATGTDFRCLMYDVGWLKICRVTLAENMRQRCRYVRGAFYICS